MSKKTSEANKIVALSVLVEQLCRTAAINQNIDPEQVLLNGLVKSVVTISDENKPFDSTSTGFYRYLKDYLTLSGNIEKLKASALDNKNNINNK